MKTFVDGTIWTETDSRGVERIGFRQQYIEQVLGECFHVVQADTRRARKGCPLMVLETNDGTNRVRSPVTGTILFFSDKARNFPDRLTEDDVIVEVLPEGTVLPLAEKVKVVEAQPRVVNWAQQAIHPVDWLNVDDLFHRPAPAAAPPQPANSQEVRQRQRALEVQARNALAANRGARRPR